MKRQLDRVLRIRQMLENLSRLELERRTVEVRQLERGAERQRRLALAARSGALAWLEAAEARGTPEWLVGTADADLLRWKRARLGGWAASRRTEMEAVRRELLARQLERRQAETLAAAEQRAREKNTRRREQNLVDDWFQSRAARNDSVSD